MFRLALLSLYITIGLTPLNYFQQLLIHQFLACLIVGQTLGNGLNIDFLFILGEFARNIYEVIFYHRLQILALLGQVAILLRDLFVQDQLGQEHRMLDLILFHFLIYLLILFDLFVEQHRDFVEL